MESINLQRGNGGQDGRFKTFLNLVQLSISSLSS